MGVGKLKTGIALVQTVVDTLRISIRTLADVKLGRFQREVGDQRLRWWAGRLLGYAEIHPEIHNPHGVTIEAGQPTILMSSHASLYDIPLAFVALEGTIRMLTKKELFAIPIWGHAMRAAEFIAIDRSNRERALRDLDLAKAKMSEGICLWVAPEGTRSVDGSLGAFKKGGFVVAIETGARIIPMGIRGAAEVLPAGTFDLHTGPKIEVHIGEPIDTTGYGIEGRDRLMADVRAVIARLAGQDDTPVGP